MLIPDLTMIITPSTIREISTPQFLALPRPILVVFCRYCPGSQVALALHIAISRRDLHGALCRAHVFGPFKHVKADQFADHLYIDVSGISNYIITCSFLGEIRDK